MIGCVASCMGEVINYFLILLWKLEGEWPLGRPGCGWEVCIKMDLKEIGCEGVYWSVVQHPGVLYWFLLTILSLSHTCFVVFCWATCFGVYGCYQAHVHVIKLLHCCGQRQIRSCVYASKQEIHMNEFGVDHNNPIYETVYQQLKEYPHR
jgi:hypothetical protein